MKLLSTCKLAAILASVFIGSLFSEAIIKPSYADVEQPAAKQINEKQLRAGERMYREGILPSGKSMSSEIAGGTRIPGSAFSCESCHLRSGIGVIEEGVGAPSINGATLFNPRHSYKDIVKNEMAKTKGVKRISKPIRPAYTDATLARALKDGINPDGKPFQPLMPRYNLADGDMQLLIGYLHTLSAEYSPGVTDKTLRFATIVTDDVSKEDRQAMLAPLETLVSINRNTQTQRNLPQFAKMFRMLGNSYFRLISIEVWELKGAPETWRTQLEEYQRKDNVFAILGGISGKSWQPIHDFCEERRIPCLLPVTDLPVISETGWYTLYASKGYYQEGETAARFIAGKQNKQQKVLQVVRGTQKGEALASGFNSAWKENDLTAVETVTLKPDQAFGATELNSLLKKYQPDTVLMWGGEEIAGAFSGLPVGAAPEIFVSSRYFGKSLTAIPEAVRDRVYITYPYRLPEKEKVFAGYADVFLMGKLKHKDENRIASRMFSTIHMFLFGLEEMKFNFYRETLLDVIGMSPDQYLPDYERYSFGAGQRYASKGCYIVQLEKGANPKLVKKSDWVVF